MSNDTRSQTVVGYSIILALYYQRLAESRHGRPPAGWKQMGLYLSLPGLREHCRIAAVMDTIRLVDQGVR